MFVAVSMCCGRVKCMSPCRAPISRDNLKMRDPGTACDCAGRMSCPPACPCVPFSLCCSRFSRCQQIGRWEAREAPAWDDDARRRRRRRRSGVPAIRSTPAGGPRRSRRWLLARGGVAPQARAWSSVQRIGSGRAAMARGGEAARRRWVGRRLAATAHAPRALWRSGFGARLQCGRSLSLIVSVSKSTIVV